MRLFFHFILVIVSLYMYGNAPKSIDEKYMVECFIVALLSILLYFFTSVPFKRDDIYLIYL